MWCMSDPQRIGDINVALQGYHYPQKAEWPTMLHGKRIPNLIIKKAWLTILPHIVLQKVIWLIRVSLWTETCLRIAAANCISTSSKVPVHKDRRM